MHKYLILTAAILLLATTACAPRTTTLNEARGQCFTYSTGGGGSLQNENSGGDACADVNVICEAFLDKSVLAPLDRQSCLAACESARREQYRVHMTDGCYPYTKRAYELCDLYCRSKK